MKFVHKSVTRLTASHTIALVMEFVARRALLQVCAVLQAIHYAFQKDVVQMGIRKYVADIVVQKKLHAVETVVVTLMRSVVQEKMGQKLAVTKIQWLAVVMVSDVNCLVHLSLTHFLVNLQKQIKDCLTFFLIFPI